jgi:ABC-type bacteriocin/lantibiotic exporter with double-glycine peptidase domain
MSFTLPQNPPVVTQQTDETCWAAALESWQRSVHTKVVDSQHQLIKKFGTHGIGMKRFERHTRAWEMNYRLVTLNDFPSSHEIEHTLRSFGYLYIAFDSDKGWWHCNVLYGIETPLNDEPFYRVMDPGEDGLKTRLKASFYPRYGSRLFVGWHNIGK